MKILHVINNYDLPGGAEKALSNILKDPTNEHVLLCLGKLDSSLFELKEHCPPVQLLPPLQVYRSKASLVLCPQKLVGVINDVQPDLLSGWMYTPNIALALAAKIGRIKTPIIWNVRHALDDLENEPLRTKLSIKLSRMLSKSPDVIIYNSSRSMRQHESYGFNKKSVFLPNGVDVEKFNIRHITSNTGDNKSIGMLKIGTLGRNHLNKNHLALVRCAKKLAEKTNNFTVTLMGKDTHLLQTAVNELELKSIVQLEDSGPNVAEFLRSLDMFVLPSVTEGFPNVLAEAMASGLFCVAYNVGECEAIVGEKGLIVEKDDEDGLVKAILVGMDIIRHNRHSAIDTHNRIASTYSVGQQASGFNRLCEQTLSQHA